MVYVVIFLNDQNSHLHGRGHLAQSSEPSAFCVMNIFPLITAVIDAMPMTITAVIVDIACGHGG